MHTINLPYKQGYVTPVPAAVVVNTYEFREAEDPSFIYALCVSILLDLILISTCFLFDMANKFKQYRSQMFLQATCRSFSCQEDVL